MFWSYYLQHWFLFYAVFAPVFMFLVKPDAPGWLKSGRIVISVLAFHFFAAASDYAKIKTEILKTSQDHSCWVYDLYFFLLFTFLSAIYVGALESIWRSYYKQWSWRIKENLQFGITSSLVVLIFIFSFINFLLLIIGFKYLAMFELLIFLEIRGFVQTSIITLAC